MNYRSAYSQYFSSRYSYVGNIKRHIFFEDNINILSDPRNVLSTIAFCKEKKIPFKKDTKKSETKVSQSICQNVDIFNLE